jgi:hypothetical protein
MEVSEKVRLPQCLAHEEGSSSRSIYNKAEYAEQRRHMLQEWADMVDAWAEGRAYMATLLPVPKGDGQVAYQSI